MTSRNLWELKILPLASVLVLRLQVSLCKAYYTYRKVLRIITHPECIDLRIICSYHKPTILNIFHEAGHDNITPKFVAT